MLLNEGELVILSIILQEIPPLVVLKIAPEPVIVQPVLILIKSISINLPGVKGEFGN